MIEGATTSVRDTNVFRTAVLSSYKTSMLLRASELNKSCMTNNHNFGSETDSASPNSDDVQLSNDFLSKSQKNVATLKNLHIVETIHQENTNES